MSEATSAVMGVKEFEQVLARGVKAIDLRPLAVFGRSHVKGAIGIPYTPANFVPEIQDALPAGDIALIEDIPALTERAATELEGAGYRVVARLQGGTRAWEGAGMPMDALGQATADELHEDLEAGHDVTVLDVREPYELRAGRIASAINIPMGQFAAAVRDLDAAKTYVLVCASGARSAAAQAYMHRFGIRDTKNLVGGMVLWQGSGRPIDRG